MAGERRAASIWWENSHFILRSLIVGIATLLPGILILWIASNNPDDVVAATFWSQVATTLISLGVVGVLYESFLKTAFLRDMHKSLGLNSALLEAGLEDALREPDPVRMKELFGSSKFLDIFPADPLTWHVQNYPWLISLAQTRKIVIRIYLPSPTTFSASKGAPGGQTPQERTEAVAGCASAFQEYRTSWDSAGFKSGGSRLERFSYLGSPHGGFVIGSNAAAIFVEDPVGVNRHMSGLAFLYRGPQARQTIEWLTAAIGRLDAAPIDGSKADDRESSAILPLIGHETPNAVEKQGAEETVG